MNTSLTTFDGLTLRLQDWPLAENTRARGTVLIVHGLGEHSGRYQHVAAQLNAWGWHAAGYDHRGHGRSEGGRAQLNTGDDLLIDLAAVIDTLRQHHPGPLVLLGHSLGGLTVARFVAEGVGPGKPAPWYRPVDAVVLSSPALAADTTAIQKLLLAIGEPLAPNLGVNNGIKTEWLSRDPKVLAAYRADPLVHDRITAKLGRFILDGGALVRQRAAQWVLPTLLLFAGSDRCVAPRGSREFAAAAPTGVVTAREFGPLFHEIFNEPEQAEVFAVIKPWLQALKLPARG